MLTVSKGLIVVFLIFTSLEVAAKSLCFDKVAESASEKILTDAKKLFSRDSVKVEVYSVRSVSSINGAYVSEMGLEIPKIDGFIDNYEVEGQAYTHYSNGGQVVTDTMNVYTKGGTCNVIGVVRNRSKADAHCFDVCDQNAVFDEVIFKSLYK